MRTVHIGEKSRNNTFPRIISSYIGEIGGVGAGISGNIRE